MRSERIEKNDFFLFTEHRRKKSLIRNRIVSHTQGNRAFNLFPLVNNQSLQFNRRHVLRSFLCMYTRLFFLSLHTHGWAGYHCFVCCAYPTTQSGYFFSCKICK